MTILGLAIVTLMQLSSQGLRLLRLSGDYQQAVLVADRLVRTVEVPHEGVEAGQEGPFQWERRVALVPMQTEEPVGIKRLLNLVEPQDAPDLGWHDDFRRSLPLV